MRPRPASKVQARIDRMVHENLRWTALVAGITFFAFFVMHLTPLGSGLPSQVGGNLVGAAGLLGLAYHLRRRGRPLARPNVALAGVFVWILAGDAFLTYTEHSAVSLNVGLFVIMLGGALLFSLPALIVTISAATAEGLFVASLVPGGHLPSQAALSGAAAAIALLVHATRVRTQRRLDHLLADEEVRRGELEASMLRTQASEERFRRLADAAFEGLAIHDQGRFVDCNAAFEEMFGYPPGGLVGKTAFDIIHESGHATIHARLATPMDDAYTTTGVRRDGTTFPVEIAGKPIPFGGRMLRVVAIRDLTERRRVEEAMREQTVARRIVRRALAADSSPDATVLAERRLLGRSIAIEAQAPTLEEGLRTFRAMGLGELWALGEERGRWTFAGHDMLDLSPGARMPACGLAVGYLEGLLSTLRGEEMRGAELACQSQGHASCRFVAMPKAQPVERGGGASVDIGSVGSRSVPSPTLTTPGSLRPPSGPP